MKKSKPKKKKLSNPAEKKFHAVFYVDNSSSMLKTFFSKKKMRDFVDEFIATSPPREDGYWIDYVVTDIHGSISYEDEFYPSPDLT